MALPSEPVTGKPSHIYKTTTEASICTLQGLVKREEGNLFTVPRSQQRKRIKAINMPLAGS
ncbi:MAG TPA: hypothetical protein ACN46N_06285, partial [Prochlorococcus sp.]